MLAPGPRASAPPRTCPRAGRGRIVASTVGIDPARGARRQPPHTTPLAHAPRDRGRGDWPSRLAREDHARPHARRAGGGTPGSAPTRRPTSGVTLLRDVRARPRPAPFGERAQRVLGALPHRTAGIRQRIGRGSTQTMRGGFSRATIREGRRFSASYNANPRGRVSGSRSRVTSSVSYLTLLFPRIPRRRTAHASVPAAPPATPRFATAASRPLPGRPTFIGPLPRPAARASRPSPRQLRPRPRHTARPTIRPRTSRSPDPAAPATHRSAGSCRPTHGRPAIVRARLPGPGAGRYVYPSPATPVPDP